MNYTRPNDPDHKDDPKDWLNSALLFGSALGQLLENNSGVVVDVKGDSFNPVGDSKKVIVFKREGQIVIDDFDQDLPEGAICKIIEE
jgi:hypothetical protein